jgi:hypothetical protein
MVPMVFPALRSSPPWPLLPANLLSVFCACWFGLAIDATGPTHPPGQVTLGQMHRHGKNQRLGARAVSLCHHSCGIFGRLSAAGNLLNLLICAYVLYGRAAVMEKLSMPVCTA